MKIPVYTQFMNNKNHSFMKCKIIENYLKSKGHRDSSLSRRSTFNSINSYNGPKSIPRMRFTELGSLAGEVDKDENLEAMDFEIKFPNDKDNSLLVHS
jgi:hypothetical protein